MDMVVDLDLDLDLRLSRPIFQSILTAGKSGRSAAAVTRGGGQPAIPATSGKKRVPI